MEFVLPLYHVSLFLLLSISFNQVGRWNLVSADDTLIKIQCHNAEVPATCIQCVKSDPRSVSADKVGIAAIVITCLSNNAEILLRNMSTLASSVHDKNVKWIFQGCEKGFSEVKTDLIKAMNRLKNKDYDQTNRLVSTALEQEIYCKKNVMDFHLRVPYVLYEMRLYEELSNAAMRIIDRF